MRILPFIFYLFPLLSGQHEEQIKKQFEAYFSLKEKGEFHDFSRFYPEEVLESVPASLLESAITQTFENPAFRIQVTKGRIDSVSRAVTHEGIQYAQVHYSFDMTFTMNPESDFSMFDFILQSVRNTTPHENIQADISKGVIEVIQTARMFAIRKPSDSWKFLEINPQLEEIARAIIPVEVQDAI